MIAMSESFEPLERELILEQLSGASRAWLKRFEIHEEIDSTNSHLLRLADAGIDGIVSLAEHQTRGKGRRGRTWLDQPGRGIALSLGRRVHRPLAEIAPIGLVVGVAVADALRRMDVSSVSLKWPNDVLIGGAKAGGILVEVASATAPQIVVGVGLNVGGTAEIAAQLGRDIGAVRRGNAELSRNTLAAALIDAIVQRLSEFEADGFGPIREQWAALDAYRDRTVRIHAPSGDTFGVARGVTGTGELRLETDAGVFVFNSGEVSLREQV